MFLSKPSLLALTALLPYALAEVPASLSTGFDTEMQVNFQGDSSRGFKDGETIPFPDTANDPVFALGDSSGVNTAVTFMIMMLDTTDESNFILHYAQSDFKATGDKTGLGASGEPMVPYAEPGSLGESGERQYTFLLFQLKSDSKITTVPNAGDKFDSEAFTQSNSLEPPSAGVSMKVNIGDVSAQDASSSTSAAAPVAPGKSATPTTLTNTATTASVSKTASSSGISTNGTGAEADVMMIKKPVGKPVGGGIVTTKPFPESA